MDRNKETQTNKGQTMVEFALVLPLVLTIVFGVIEFGFLLWSYSSVNSAAREAARYGIAIGEGDVSGQRYYDCEGIKDAAMRAGTFAGMEVTDISIHYDNGPTNDPGYEIKYDTCEELAALSGDDTIEFGDRIVVTVTHDYQPIASLIGFNIQPFNMNASANRTIVKSAEVVAAGSGGGGGGGGTPACFNVSTSHIGNGGDPSISPGSSSGCNLTEYLAGENLTLTASPDTGWYVVGWSGTDNDASTSTTNTVSMPGGSTAISVTYSDGSPTCYSLSLSSTGSGSGTGPSASPAKSAVCATGYLAGETITLSATADAGSIITGWSGTENDASTNSTNTVIMPSSNHSASVAFDLNTTVCHTLTVSHVGSGSNPVPSAKNCTGGYLPGTVVTLNATANEGYEITSWSGTDNDSSTSSVNTVTMTSDKSVSVTYEHESALDPPLNVYIPNGPGDWQWKANSNQCRKVDLRWSTNGSWPESPIKYEVYKESASYGYETDFHWDSNFTFGVGQYLTLGVRAIFSGGLTSSIQEVTYVCYENDLVFWGSVVK